ncbi:MAG: BREX system ATP-binding domain-containing protein [Sandaracinus sp.]
MTERPLEIASLGPFAERFAIEAVLGHGGFGTVLRALDRRQGRRVALKIPHDTDAQGLLAIKREFRVLAGVSHPNLVAFHELFVGPSECFFSMELVRGMDCVQWVERAGTASIPRVAAGLASGLEHLHALGILHGDLKPSNAWVDAHGTPVLLDFGLAREAAGPSHERLAGTLPFLAPELFRGARPSPATDLYALGALLYELVTGRPAFSGTSAEIVGQKLSGVSPVVATARGGVSAEMLALVEALLSDDAARRPSAAALAARLGASASATLHAWVGREHELAALEAALSRAQQGAPEIVYVEGPAGIGKTTLLDRFVERAAQRDVVVLRARCSEHESVPFQALDGIVDHLATRLVHDDALRDAIRDPRALLEVADVFPVFSEVVTATELPLERRATAVSAPERRRLAVRALAEVLSDLARVRPLLLTIDDAHWADEDGARLFEELHAALVGAPVMVVVGHRSGDHGEPLEILVRAGRAGPRSRERGTPRRIVLGPLVDRDARQILRGGREERASDGSEALVAAAGGSPFLLETLSSLGDDDARALEGERDPERWIERAVLGRLASLGPEARAVFDLVCVAGHAVPHDLAAASLGLEPDVLALRQLGALRLVRTVPGRGRSIAIEPYHDHLSRLVRARLGPDRTQRLHRALARTLVGRDDADPMWLCLHLRGAGELVEAARHAIEAADRAARALAFAHAAELLGFALEHHAGARGERRTLEIARADALANAGRGRESAEHYLRAADGVEVSSRVELLRRASEQYLRVGHFREGVKILEEVLESCGVEVRRTPLRALLALMRHRRWILRHGFDAGSPEGVARPASAETLRAIDALASGAIGLSVVDSIRSADMMSEALRRCLEAGDRERLAQSMSWWAAFIANEGGPSEPTTRAILASAARETEVHGGAYARGCLAAAEGLTEFHLGHFARASERFERGVRIFEGETHGTQKEASTLHIFHHAALAIGGRLEELARRTEERERISEARGEHYALVNLRSGLMILRWLAADAPERAEQDLTRAMEGFEVSGFVVQHWFDLWGRVAVRLYERRVEEARSLWERARPRVLSSLLVRTQFTRVQSLGMEALTAAARIEAGGIGPLSRARLGLWARAAIDRSRAEDRRWTRAYASVLEACLRGAYGERSRASAMLEDTAEALDGAELGLYAMLVRHQLGQRDARHRAIARAWAEGEGVVDADRLARAITPGLRCLAR